MINYHKKKIVKKRVSYEEEFFQNQIMKSEAIIEISRNS